MRELCNASVRQIKLGKNEKISSHRYGLDAYITVLGELDAKGF
jgi:hypothetical protein